MQKSTTILQLLKSDMICLVFLNCRSLNEVKVHSTKHLFQCSKIYVIDICKSRKYIIMIKSVIQSYQSLVVALFVPVATFFTSAKFS